MFHDIINRHDIKFPSFSDSGLVGLFIVSPLLTLPYILPKSIKGEKIPLFLLSMFLGVVSICFVPPRADLYRIYVAFFEIQNQSFSQVIENLRFDFLLPFAQYFFGKIGFDFEIIRFIEISVSYILFFNLYQFIINKKLLNHVKKVYLFLIILLSVPFMATTLGVRYGFAVTIVGYVIIKRCLFGYKSISDIILLLIGVSIHFSVIGLVILLLAASLLPNRLPKLMLVGIITIAYLSSFFLNEVLLLLAFDDATAQLVSHYSSDGIYGQRYIYHNFIGSIPEYFSICIVYVFFCYFLIKIPYSKETKVLYLIWIGWAFSQQFFTLHSRINIILLLLCPLYITMITPKYIMMILSLLSVSALLVITINWRAYTISNSLFIILPLPYILGFGYEYAWIKENVDEGGTLLIYKR